MSQVELLHFVSIFSLQPASAVALLHKLRDFEVRPDMSRCGPFTVQHQNPESPKLSQCPPISCKRIFRGNMRKTCLYKVLNTNFRQNTLLSGSRHRHEAKRKMKLERRKWG